MGAFCKEIKGLIAQGGYGGFRASYSIDGVIAVHRDFSGTQGGTKQ
jgi:hypothetical protein